MIVTGNRIARRWLLMVLSSAWVTDRIAVAQPPEAVVRWSAVLDAPSGLKHGRAATLSVSGKVLEGWHVYALAQKPGGPTPLRVTLDDNPIVRLAGYPSGTEPEEKHDPSFDLDTRFYRRTFALRVPITVKRTAREGAQLISVDVHFQSCSERVCLPPRTIQLSVPITVLPDT
jgi:Disulphide bond corrector protein DsbC